MRSILAVVAGLAVAIVGVMIVTPLAAVLAGSSLDDPPTAGYLVLNLIGSALAAMAGGITAMRLAPHTPHGHVVALAAVILLMSLPTLFAEPAAGQPSWYGLAVSLLGPASVVAGGLLGMRWREAARHRRAATGEHRH